MTEMRPESVHLIAQIVRHSRGMINAFEKFERTIPREHRATEIGALVDFARAACAAADKILTASPDS